MPYLILVRHGESQLNAQYRQSPMFCGQLETPLTQRGRQQAQDVGRVLAARTDLQPLVAVSSALTRAQETLSLLLEQFPHPPDRLESTPELNERSLGEFEGRLVSEVYEEYPQYKHDPRFNQFRNDFEQRAPGGENLAEVTNRALSCLETLSTNWPDHNLLVVSHAMTIRCLITSLLSLNWGDHTFSTPNATPIIIKLGDRPTLVEGLSL